MNMLVTDAPRWIQDICRQFTQATGWPMEYVPADGANRVDDEPPQLIQDSFWSAEINDGNQRLGYLSIQLPADQCRDRSFLATCEMAELLATLLSKINAAQRKLDSRTQELSTLVDIGLALPKKEDILGTLNQLLRASVQLTGFRNACFFLLNPSTNELSLRSAFQREPQSIPFHRRDLRKVPPDLHALAHDKILIQRQLDPDIAHWLPEDCRTSLCVAVQSDAGPIGTMWAFDRRHRNPSDREVHVLLSIAAQIASVLERVVLLKESETQHRLKQELRIASESQAIDILSELPMDVGFDAAGICTSHYEVGGDLCELIPLDANRTVVAVGDASGDSIPAALIMSAVRGSLRSLTLGPRGEAIQTEQVVSRINRTLYSITPPHQFMSMLYGILDTRAGTFTYTNAGHPTPLFVHDGTISLLQSHGMLLGVVPDADYDSSTIEVGPDSMLVLFSDGITEAMNGSRQMFRSDGIIGAVERHMDGSAEDVLQAILQQLDLHIADGGDGDDRTLLVIRMRSG